MGNIINITFGVSDHQQVSIYQYDRGQILHFNDVPDLAEVQFVNGDTTINVIVTNSEVAIPESLLDGSSFKAYVTYIDENSVTTIKELDLYITSRTMPSNYVEPVEQASFREQMQAIMNSALGAAVAANTTAGIANTQSANALGIAETVERRANSGEFIGPQGPQGVQGEVGPAGPSYDDTELREEIENINDAMRNLIKQSDLVSYNIPVIYTSQFDTDNAFEINIRLRYSMKYTDGLLCNSSSWYGSMLMQTTSGLVLALAISSNGTSADIGTIRLNFPSNNTSTIYRIVFKYNGIDAYELGLYDDEGTLITSDTITSTLKINKPGSALYIGRDLERIYDNSIFTKGTYINQGNTIVWGVK